MTAHLLVGAALVAVIGTSPLAGRMLARARPGRRVVSMSAVLIPSAPFPTARGQSRYAEDGRGWHDLNNELVGTGLPEMTPIDLYLDGEQILAGSLILPAVSRYPTGTYYNAASFYDADSQVPLRPAAAVRAGSVVEWRTPAGVTIATGTFRA